MTKPEQSMDEWDETAQQITQQLTFDADSPYSEAMRAQKLVATALRQAYERGREVEAALWELSKLGQEIEHG